MESNPPGFAVSWCAPNAAEAPLESGSAALDVADGLLIRLECFELPDQQVAVEFSLHGKSLSRDGCTVVGSRFVVIPTSAAELIVGVAEESDTPATLMPTCTRPRWLFQAGGPEPTQHGILWARHSTGTGIAIQREGGQDTLEAACLLRVSASPETCRSGVALRMTATLSISVASPARLRIVTDAASGRAVAV